MLVNYFIATFLLNAINLGLSQLTRAHITDNQFHCDINEQTVDEFNCRNVTECDDQPLPYPYDFRFNYNINDINDNYCETNFCCDFDQICSHNNSMENEKIYELFDVYRDCSINFAVCKHTNTNHNTNDGNKPVMSANKMEFMPNKSAVKCKSNATDDYDGYIDHCKRGLESVKTVVNTIVVMFAIIIAAYIFCVFDHPLIVTL